MNLSRAGLLKDIPKISIKPSMVFGMIIFSALIAFEMFNYSTTDFALRDLLGELRFMNIRWATILTIAFCGIDFAGIARLFTPRIDSNEPNEVWYLFGAWLLAATMNAMLTWWGVSMAIANHNIQSTAVVDHNTLIKVVPIFVAVMVWVIRILIIGTISMSADHLIGNGPVRHSSALTSGRKTARTSHSTTGRRTAGSTTTRAAMPRSARGSDRKARPEPTYHGFSMASPPGEAGRPSRGTRKL